MVLPIGKHGKQIRRGVTLQLVEGDDDDLIAAIETLPPGRRMPTLKKALRAALGYIVPEPDITSLDYSPQLEDLSGRVQWVQQAISDLKPYLDGLFAKGAVFTASPFTSPEPVEDEKARATREALERRAKRINGSKWS